MKQEKKKQLLKKALEHHHGGDLNSADEIYLEILKNDKNLSISYKSLLIDRLNLSINVV